MSGAADPTGTVYDFSATSLEGDVIPLDRYRGRVLLIVNVASRCGYTPQYRGLEALYRRHHDRGLSVLGFPCDQFGRQEPGTEDEIRTFCTREYDVTFPMFSKIKVNGPDAHPLFRFLKAQQAGWLGTRAIKWNFTKFLVARQGQVLARYGSREVPDAFEPVIVSALDAGAEPAGR